MPNPNEFPIAPLDFMVDVTKQTQMFTSNKTPSTTQGTLQVTNLPAEEYWTKLGVQNYYNKGVMLGSTGNSQADLEAFLKAFRKVIEEIVRTELTAKEKTSEEFKDDFKIIEHTYNNIVSKIKKNGITTDNNRVLATLHGFINSFTGKQQNG